MDTTPFEPFRGSEAAVKRRGVPPLSTKREIVTLTMVGLPNVEDFPSWHDFEPCDDKFTCIYYLVDQGRRCRRTINKNDRFEASSLHKKALEAPSAQDFSGLLSNLAELSCCKQNHRKLVQGSRIQERLCLRWQKEIQDGDRVKFRDQEDKDISVLRPSVGTNSRSICRPQTSENIPRYNLRPGSSRTCEKPKLATAEEVLPVSEFVAHVKSPDQTFVSTLLRPLGLGKASKPNSSATPEWQKSGSIYCFSRASSPGMVKIGYTTGPVWVRLSRWKTTCHYQPLLKFFVEDVPHVKRAELLIHFELLKHWRRERMCKYCLARHQEWFEVDAAVAETAIKNVTTWMKVARPYDEDGFLSQKWRKIIRNLEKQGIQVTSQRLLEAFYGLEEKSEQVSNSQQSTNAQIKDESEGMARPSMATFSTKLDDKVVAYIAELVSLLRSDQVIQPRSSSRTDNTLSTVCHDTLHSGSLSRPQIVVSG